MGQGTGLGVASTYSIIKNHNGNIVVRSVKGEGTTFDIFPPAVEKRTGTTLVKSHISSDVAHGAETVLLVDDEDMVLEVGQEMLERLSYKVLVAMTGKEALKVYQAHGGDIHLVILDMIMPGMAGTETYDRLKEANPEVVVLLSSGYSIDGQAAEILKRGCNGFIQKPFTMAALSQKIREMLTSA